MNFKLVKLGDISSITKLAGFEFSKYIKYNDLGDIIALRALNLKNGRLILNEVQRIDKETSDKLPRSKLFKNEIVLTYTGNGYGDAAFIKENDKYHLAPNIAKITPNNTTYPLFLFEFIKSDLFRKQLRNFVTGSSQPTIPMRTLRKLFVPFPNYNIQSKIGYILNLLDKKIELNIKLNQNLI